MSTYSGLRPFRRFAFVACFVSAWLAACVPACADERGYASTADELIRLFTQPVTRATPSARIPRRPVRASRAPLAARAAVARRAPPPHVAGVAPHRVAVAPHRVAVAPHHVAVAPRYVAVAPHRVAVAPHRVAVAPQARGAAKRGRRGQRRDALRTTYVAARRLTRTHPPDRSSVWLCDVASDKPCAKIAAPTTHDISI